MVEYDRTQQREQAEKSGLKICVVGVGGAGSNVIDRITTDRTVDATLVAMQTDVRVLHNSISPKKLQLGIELMRGVGAGGDPDLGREAALYSKEQIREVLDGHDMIFISVGLGGGTGSGAAPVIAEIAKNTGATVLVFAAVPFNFEGRRRTTQAREALERLQKSADALILFENNRMGELLLPKEGIQKAFVLADTLISQSVRAVTNMLSAPGLVKLGLADLVSALRVTDGRCLFGFGEAKGQNRGTEALKRALKSPLINQGQLLQCAQNLLVHVVGGESLTITEVEVIMKQLGRHVPDDTQILFGLGVDPKLGESLSVTLISALSATQLASLSIEEAEELAPAPVERRAPRPAPAPKSPQTLELFASSNGNGVHSDEELETRPTVAMKAAVASVPPPPAELFKPSAPEPAPARVAKPTPAPEPLPEPVAEVEPEEVEVVYQRDADEEVEEEEVVAPVMNPRNRDEGIKLSQVIGLGTGKAATRATARLTQVVDEIELGTEPESPNTEANDAFEVTGHVELTPVLQAQPETAAIPIRRETTVRARTVEATPAARQPQPNKENEFFTPAVTTMQATPVAIAPATTTPAAEQQTFRLGQEDRGRFKDTEPAIVQGEDLDIPTWMRLRKKLKR